MLFPQVGPVREMFVFGQTPSERSRAAPGPLQRTCLIGMLQDHSKGPHWAGLYMWSIVRCSLQSFEVYNNIVKNKKQKLKEKNREGIGTRLKKHSKMIKLNMFGILLLPFGT